MACGDAAVIGHVVGHIVDAHFDACYLWGREKTSGPEVTTGRKAPRSDPPQIRRFPTHPHSRPVSGTIPQPA